MKKRIVSLLLAVFLLLPVTAHAAQSNLSNFVRTKTYSGQFSDLSPSSTHYANVAALYEYGLSQGRADGTFGLAAPMRVSEMLIFASRIRSVYRSGDAEAGAAAQEGSTAALRHLAYLKSEGVLGDELDAALPLDATRAQMAHVLVGVLPGDLLPPVNNEIVTLSYASGKFIPDVTEYTPYYQDILQLYRCGIVVGSDSMGRFFPAQSITRGAATAMFTRVVEPALRLTPNWTLTPTYSLENVGYGNFAVDSVGVAAPATLAEMDRAMRYMFVREEYTLNLNYDSLTLPAVRNILEMSLAVAKEYCEQGYNSVSANYEYSPGRITLTFSSSAADATRTQAYRQEALSAAIAIHDELWRSGRIREGMTEFDKAKVYYDWICQNTRYDTPAGDDSVSHLPYAVFAKKLAVCDGYTGAYNMLLKLEGISCSTQTAPDHIWTVATLDGTSYHIDTTWGDSSNSYTDYAYFAMTQSQAWAAHAW